MYRPGSGNTNMSSSSRSKESSSSGSRSSRSGASTSGSSRGRSPRRSPSPRGRRRRSPSGSRSSRRSPSPRRSTRRHSPGRHSRSPGRRSRSPGRRSRSPGRRSRSPGRRSRSPGRRSRSPGRHSRSPGRRSRSPGRRSRSTVRRSHSPGRRSLSQHSESSVEQNLRITVGNDRYGIDTPERKRFSDRLGSPVDSLSDVDRDDLADGPIFSRRLSRPRSVERYPSHEENPSPFSMRHDEDYRSRNVFVHQPDYGMNYDHLQDQPRETVRDGEPLRKSLYSSEDRGREPKRPRYDRLLDANMEPQGFLPGIRNYRKRSFSRSPSPTYLDKDFRELESARRRKEKEELSRNLSQELPGNGYTMPSSTNPVQSSEPRYLSRPDDAPAMPKKSILKKRVEEPSVQPEVFPSSSVKEPPLLSNPPSLSQPSSFPAFSLEVENFLKRFNKNAVAELAANKESQRSLHDWKPYSDQQQNASPFEQNSGSFLTQADHRESAFEPADHQADFLLPHERASQDGSGFSRILGMMADSTSTQEKRRRSFPDDIEDEEKFLYGDDDDDDDSKVNSPCTQKPTLIDGKEPVRQKISSPPPPSPPVKPDTSEDSRPEYEKIHDLLRTIGLDIGVAEIGKLAARTQERLHGKKPSRSPDRHSVASHKPEVRERRRSRSNTHSPESSRKRSLSPSGSFPPSKDTSSVSVSDHNKDKGQSSSAGMLEPSAPPVPIIPSAPPSLPNLSPPTSVSQYSVSRFPPFTATQLPQNYPPPTMPPPGYDAYRHYMAYAASGWPMYAQQADPPLSDVHGLVTLTVPPNPTRPNLRVIETVSTEKGTPDVKRDESVLVQIPTATSYSKMLPQYSQPSFETVKERIADERNRASQKQKVMEEREKLKAEQEARQKKLQYLKTELNRLSKQQGEMLRKKRREKDGHKDPLLVEVNRLQENIMKEIAQLKMSADAAEKKQSELDKVAQILGINISEKSRKLSAENKDPSEKNQSENAKLQERPSGSIKESKAPNDKPKAKCPKPTDTSLQPSKQHLQGTSIYDYYDTGNHWCKDCNTICGTMFDYFTHMHNKKHRQTLDPYNRPWASKTENETKQEVTKHIDKIPVPAKGSEFLMPVTGYYCQLCHEFFGDQISAEQHVKSHPHNEKYKKHIDENPLYEERRNLDHQAGLSVIQETEHRLKRKQCEKQNEEKEEKTIKTARKEEPKSTKELGDGDNEYDANKKKDIPSGQKCGIKLRLKKDDKEVEKKEGKKEDSSQESRLPSFGKFSWRKTERDEKNQGKDVALSKEESAEECKDKESKSQSGKPNSKPIAIKLSGKTVIPHTSPWTPVVSTSSQAKIKPNLPVPTMVLRKSATATVSKPAPLNTFLSIKSSGATTKPLPVVKEGNIDIFLPPDIISKAFGGEVVVLKGSQEDAKAPEQAEEPEQESVTKAVEHAKTLEQAKASAVKAQEQSDALAKAQAKARELATMAKDQEVIRMAKINEQSLIFERPQRRPPLLPLPPGPPLALTQQQQPLVFYPLPPLPPPKQTALLADDMAPGVSEDDKNILAMPMCPRPLPPPAFFRDHTKKIEKKNTSLAAGNAQDLYDIFYNSSVRSPADSKLVNSSSSDKGKLHFVEKEKNTDLLADSKPRNNSLGQQSIHNVCDSSSVSKIPLGEGTSETQNVTTENILAVSEESTELKASVDEESEKISFSDTQSTFGNREASEFSSLPTSDSVSFQKQIEMGIHAQIESSKKSPKLEKEESVTQLSESNTPVLESDCKKPSELARQVSESSDDNKLAVQLSEEVIAPLEDTTMKPIKCETSVVMQFSESSVSPLKGDNKPSELARQVSESSDDNKLAMQLSEEIIAPLEDITMKPIKCETSVVMQFSESSVSPLNGDNKKPSELARPVSESSDDNKLAMQLSEEIIAPLEDITMKPIKCETSIVMHFSESSVSSLKGDNKKQSELETAGFKCSDDNKLAIQFLEGIAAPVENISMKPLKCETSEVVPHFLENSAPPLKDNKPLELEIAEFKCYDDNKLAMQLSEEIIAPLEDITMKPIKCETSVVMQFSESSVSSLKGDNKKPSELETAEFKCSDDNKLAIQLLEDIAAPVENVSMKPLKYETSEVVPHFLESNAPPLKVDNKPLELEIAEFKCYDDNKLTMQLSEEIIAPLEDITMKPIKCETVVMQFSESSVSPLKGDNKKPSELETAKFKCSDDNKLAIQLLGDIAAPVENVSMKPLKCETSEVVSHFPESNAPPLEVDNKKPLELEIAGFKCYDDDKLTIQLSEDTSSVEDVSMRPLKCETSEIVMQLSESAASLECDNKKPSELETAKFKCPDDNELRIQLLEYTVPLLEDVEKKPSKPETAELTGLLPDSNAAILEELHNPVEPETTEFKSVDKFALPLSEDRIAPLEDVILNPSELETEEFNSDDKESAAQLPEKEIDFNKNHMRYVSITNGKDIDGKLQDQQIVGSCDESKLEKNECDLEMKAYMTSSGERDLGTGHPELPEHHFALSQGDNSQLFELQETEKEGSLTTEDKLTAGTSEVIASTWVSDMCMQNQLAWGPVDSCSKVNEEDLQTVVTDQSSSKEPLLNLKVDTVGFDKLEPATARDEIPQTSEIQSLDPEFKLLNKGDPDSFHTSNEQELSVSSQPKDGKKFNVDDVPESREILNECLTNVTLISKTLGKCEEINQQPLSCDGKDIQREEALGSISSTNDVEPSSNVELMFIKNGTHEMSRSDMELNDNEETGIAETESVSYPSVHSEMVQEPLNTLSTEITVRHLGEDALTFTDINTGVLNTPTAGDFDLNTTYSELGFHQSTTLALNLNIENERETPKSDEPDEIKPTDPPKLKTGLELESINFSLGDIEMERERLDILPSEILNEDTIDSSKLETVVPISLGSCKTNELDISQQAVESEIIDFVALTSGEEEDKFCPLVSDVTAPHVVSSSSDGDTAEPSTPLVEMQDRSPDSKVLQENVGKCGTSDMLSLSCGGQNVQNQVPTHIDTLLPDLKVSVEVGGSGDSELYNAKNEIQISGGELIKTEEENSDIQCAVDSKSTSEVTESSTEHLLL